MKNIILNRILIISACVLYFFVSIWIFLFKCNLVELYFLSFKPVFIFDLFRDVYKDGVISWGNVRLYILNVIGFIPVGYLFSMLFKKHKFILSLVVAISLTCVIEGVQYLLAFGSSQLIDILLNILGGLIGAIIYKCINKHFSLKVQNIILSVIVGICLICIVLGAIFTIKRWPEYMYFLNKNK